MAGDEFCEFQCPKCGKKLKASSRAAGRRVKCPKCEQPVKVPGVVASPDKTPQPAPSSAAAAVQPNPVPKPAPSLDDDWLNLSVPAIADVQERKQVVVDTQAAKAKEREAKAARDRARRESHPNGKVTQANPVASSPEVSSDSREAPRSIFDDDLPELAELETPSGKRRSHADRLLAMADGGLEESLDSLVPDLGPAAAPPKSPAAKPANSMEQPRRKNVAAADAKKTPPTKPQRREPVAMDLADDLDAQALPALFDDEPKGPDAEYRIQCRTCGTAQYVRSSAQGMKIKCPDCFDSFKVPPPPAGWNSPKKKVQQSSGPDIPLAAGEEQQIEEARQKQRTRTSQMLEKAQREISDEDLEKLYDHDFDTANFVQRTFGFFKDPIAMAQVVGYGMVFAGVFAVAQFGANNVDNGYGRGALLLAVIGAPLIAILFGMPMLSGAVALLESVANRQKKVSEWPGFNLFENAGDMIAIALALIASTIPGFIVGTWLAGDGPGGGRIQIAGMMATCFLLFPVFYLSMLDNESIFAPLSNSIFRSFTEAAEAWAGYFLKTLIAFAVVMLLWFLLLGRDPALAAIGGGLLPLLIFFTCQQIGALADSIGEHLSFEFTPPSNEDEEISERESA